MPIMIKDNTRNDNPINQTIGLLYYQYPLKQIVLFDALNAPEDIRFDIRTDPLYFTDDFSHPGAVGGDGMRADAGLMQQFFFFSKTLDQGLFYISQGPDQHDLSFKKLLPRRHRRNFSLKE